ncbi:MAG: DUF1573 domain-containing protein [Nitrospirae bacterium]|nr:DUF1573 domain-containing protein [Nitrospirota bacterium]
MEIAPGDKATVTVEVLLDTAQGKAQKTVEVWTNDEEKGMITLVLHGEIVP